MRYVHFGSAELVSITEGAVPKSKNRSAEELKEYYTQPASGTRIVGRLPRDAQLEEMRKRIKDGENKDHVVAGMVDQLLWEEGFFSNK